MLAAGPIAVCLLLGTNMAVAQEVCLDGDTVIGIKGLDVLTDQYDSVTIDVDFTYSTGYEVYGSGLTDFPFDTVNKEEDVIAV